MLTTAHARRVAEGLGVSLRTVWRWLKEPSTPRPPASYGLSATDREAFAHYRGNVAALHRARQAAIDGTGHTAGAPLPTFLARGWAGADPVGLRTLQRAFARELTPAEQAAWRTGEPGRRAAGVHLTRPPTGRNQVWELDHKQIPVLVLPPRGAALCPWMTTIVDDSTRALVGWAITATPHAGTVLTAIRMALAHDPDRGPFGAVPATARVDRGLEFAAASVRKALAGLGVDVHRLPAYTPHRKGKVERLHRTLEQTLFSSLPGYTKGPRNAAGRLHGPLDDSAAGRAAAEHAPVGPLRIEDLAERVRTWARWYNTERPHRALDGRTPAQAWDEDTFAVHRIDADRLRHLLLADVERTIGKDGIRLNNLSYLAPELHGRRGQVVQVRYMPHDDRTIEVYSGKVHLCTAHPHTRLTPAQTEAFREAARAESRRLGAARRRANTRTRRELAPLVDGAPPTESRVLPAGHGDELALRRAQRRLQERSSTSLLGLDQPITDDQEG